MKRGTCIIHFYACGEKEFVLKRGTCICSLSKENSIIYIERNVTCISTEIKRIQCKERIDINKYKKILSKENSIYMYIYLRREKDLKGYK